MALIVKVLKYVTSWDEVQQSIELASRNFNEALDKALSED